QTGAGPGASKHDAAGAAARGVAQRAGFEGAHAGRIARGDAQVLGTGAADRTAPLGRVALFLARATAGRANALAARQRPPPRCLSPAPVRAGLRLGLFAARHGADRPRQADVRQGHPIGKPRSRAVVPPAVSRRRVAALRARQPLQPWRPRVLPWQHFHPRRGAGGLRRSGGLDPLATVRLPASLKSKSRLLAISWAEFALPANLAF